MPCPVCQPPGERPLALTADWVSIINTDAGED